MKVYVLAEREDRNFLDNVVVFTSKEKAREVLVEHYNSLLIKVGNWGYGFNYNEFCIDRYSLILDNSDHTFYEGCILEKEIK